MYLTHQMTFNLDVGHQAWSCNELERKGNFITNRTYGGLSGFPKREESRYDAFGVGHSSTSISAILGMALASKLKGDLKQHIAVIGDDYSKRNGF